MPTPTPAYGSVISVTGTSTPDTGEACAHLSGAGATQVFQVTSTAKRVWDPGAAITVKDGGVTVPGADYVFNYLFGTIAFVGYTPSGAITVDGSYLPIAPAVLCSKWELSAKQTLIDTSNFDAGQAVFRTPGLVEFDGSLSTFDPLNTVLDGGTGTWQSWLLNGTPKVLAINFGAGLSSFRAWVLIETEKTSSAVAGAIEGSVNWKSIVELGLAGFGFGM